jgi:hypothetical protein
MGLKLPGHFIEAGIGALDGTDVSGHLLPMRVGAQLLAAVYRSVLPLAIKYGVTTGAGSRNRDRSNIMTSTPIRRTAPNKNLAPEDVIPGQSRDVSDSLAVETV